MRCAGWVSLSAFPGWCMDSKRVVALCPGQAESDAADPISEYRLANQQAE